MTIRSALLVAAALALSCSGGDGFKDDLTFGTGMDAAAMKLTGEGTSFEAGKLVYFRLESAAKFDNRFVRLYFNKIENKDFAACASTDGHLCLTGFQVSNPGTYEVSGYLVKTVIDIGDETLIATRTITVK